MIAEELDAIHVRDLHVQGILGVYDSERHIKRDIVINYSIYYKRNDNLKDEIGEAIDYDILSENLRREIEESQFKLIESLAEFIAKQLLSVDRVLACRVMVDKPNVPENAGSTAVEILRNS